MEFLKAHVKAMLDRQGYELRRKPKHLQQDAGFGLDVLEGAVWTLVRKSAPQSLRLLQIGANDGKDEDTTRSLLLQHCIPAIVCEPLGDVFVRLQQNYAKIEHANLVRCAVGLDDGTLDLYRIDPSFHSSEATKIASTSRPHVLRFQQMWGLPEESVICESVPCKTIPTLLAAYGWNSVDIAVLDMEGMDHLICPVLLDLKPAPKIIQFEYVNSPIAAVTELMERLIRSGYRFARSGLDIVAVHSSFSA